MDGININFDETINLGIEIFNKGDEFNEIIVKVKKVLEDLSQAWQGKDADKFLNDLSEECKEMEKLAAYINEIGLLVQKKANIYQDIYLNNINN